MSENKLWGLGSLLIGSAAGALSWVDWRYGLSCVLLAGAILCFMLSINKMVDRQMKE